MSICTGIGNGLGGALGKWGLGGLGSALGLGAAVDFGVRAYTGYGLIETLSVPYIECPDGSFASAMEWYGSGLQCPPKKPEPSNQSPPSSSGAQAALGYAAEIEALGGSVWPYIGSHGVGPVDINGNATEPAELQSGHYKPTPTITDKIGNTLQAGLIQENNGEGFVRGGILTLGVFSFLNYGWGGWGSSRAPQGYNFRQIRDSPSLSETFNSQITRGRIIGLRVFLPELSKAPPIGRIPPPPSFQPSPPRQNKPDCEEIEMSCPCLTPADIERAVKRALGLSPFAPEKLVREMGARMFAAPGPSVVPVAPLSLVDAMAAIAATIYMRAGYGRYPVMMPSSLIAGDNPASDAVPTLAIENYAEWFEWFIKQQDAIQGEWPVDIAIVDGTKRQPLRFENMSEAIAELTGLMVQTATDADAAVSVASHAAVAATKAQTAAIISQKNAECIIKFFGIRTGYGSIFVDAVITPMDSDSPQFNLKKFLTPSKQSIAFFTDNDPFDFQATLDRILRNSEIAKSAVAMDASKEMVGDYARNQRKYDAAENRREAEKEFEKLETSLNTQNPDFRIKLKVDTPGTDEISGSNFVIKRPK